MVCGAQQSVEHHNFFSQFVFIFKNNCYICNSYDAVCILTQLELNKLNEKKIPTMNKKFYAYYLAPEVEVVEAVVEAGFQTSNPNVEDPEEDETQGWDLYRY